MKIVIATGGTGGHLFPALKVAEELRDRGHEVIFIGSFNVGLEKIAQRKFPYYNIPSQGFQKKRLQAILSSAGSIIQATRTSLKILKDLKPDRVLGFGGYSSFSVVIAAWVLKVPVMIHEQNAIPGRANKILSRLAKKVAISFEDARPFFPSGKTVLTGCPSHLSAGGIDKDKAYEFFGFKKENSTLFVFGGSQGSRRINEDFFQALISLKQELSIQVIHVTGTKDYDSIKEQYQNIKIPSAVFPFLDRMDYAYTIADLVISRSGAATVTEICLFECPSILVPFPYAIGDHQKYNAQVLTRRNLAVMIEEKDLSSLKLKEKICDMIKNKSAQQKIKQHFQEIAFPDAAKRLAEEVLNLK
ncbi:MAG: undecaprenyldiphospho-muramoylpentapeptide beta-N-acetylglucosaminyltransferase [Candidatus Omnitrophica bacterium]|nr:undecaprenyldiphospho-muramoylpentapeptide beta-N-acetylglucosaminyltransferase [Candidatus Omnitrophota bacterium]